MDQLLNNSEKVHLLLRWGELFAQSDHMTFSKGADTLICHTTMHRNSINFLYNPGHIALWCLEVVPVANAREGST